MLGIIYNDKQSSLKELLEKQSFISIRERNIQMLATEMYKVSKNVSLPHMNEIFESRNEHPYSKSKTKLSVFLTFSKMRVS